MSNGAIPSSAEDVLIQLYELHIRLKKAKDAVDDFPDHNPGNVFKELKDARRAYQKHLVYCFEYGYSLCRVYGKE